MVYYMIFVLGLSLLLGGFVLFSVSAIMMTQCATTKLQEYSTIGVAIISILMFLYGVYLISIDGLTILGVI
jgi:hypothetical protein